MILPQPRPKAPSQFSEPAHPPSGSPEQPASQEGQISLKEVIQFIWAHYGKLLLVTCLGGAIAAVAWFFLASYQASTTLQNGGQAARALDIVSWRTIVQSLPNLANQMVQDGKLPQDDIKLYRQMSDPLWWQKNVQPSYAISKADMKDLAAIGKDLDGASTQIVSITISAAGTSRQSAIDHVQEAKNFILTGSAYFQLRNLLNGYEGEATATRAELLRQISANQIELGFLQQRAQSLEGLLKRFPGDPKVAGQVVDPKDSGAKYLPISTQIIALNTEIYQTQETLTRLAERLTQIEIIARFLEQALPQAQTQLDGIKLANQLLGTEQGLRKSLPANDLKAQFPLDQLRARLLLIKNRFTNDLQANVAPSAKREGMIKSILGGAALALALTLIVLLGKALVRGALSASP